MIGKAIKTVLLAALALLALGIGWYFYVNLSVRESYRQKMAVEVETPAGLRSASSVVGVVQGDQKLVLGQPGGRGYADLSGEAVVLEWRRVDTCLRCSMGAMLAQQVFAPEIGLNGLPITHPDMEVWLKWLAKLRIRREMPKKLYPLLVTFADIDDPKTVRRVDPDDLAASFGPGVALKSISIEITGEKVTTGKVEQVLGWLGEYPETPVLPKIDPKDFSFEAKLRQGSFIRR